MTIRQLVSILLRRWYVMLALLVGGAALTALLAVNGGVYSSSTVISFMRAQTTSLSPTNGNGDSSIIAFAGAVVLEANGGRLPAPYSLGDAPYYGAGLREGALVELANSGNQWVSTFNTSDVEIQVVGRTYDAVSMRQRELIDTVVGVAEAKQNELALAPADRITATLVPLTTQIEYVSPSRSNQLAAAAAMLAAALITGSWASISLDRLLLRRRVTATARVAAVRPPASRHVPEGTPS